MVQSNGHNSNGEETVTLDECKKRVERTVTERVRQKKRELRQATADELLQLGELSAALKLLMKDLGKSSGMDFGLRDEAENLRNELEGVVKTMEESEKVVGPAEKPAEQGEKTETKQPATEVDQEFNQKIQTARATIDDLDLRIKHFDRLEKDISVKIELLVSRQRIKGLAVFLGGLMILIGATTFTGATLLALAPTGFPFVYSAFDEFFNYLLMLLGGILVLSGFLHQV